ncbi:MAG: hypothetical protein P9X27_03690 [Candidatus Kaelpia aquatica]|nr:hypothetical protein [Candidatus Kaelpia aquatica]
MRVKMTGCLFLAFVFSCLSFLNPTCFIQQNHNFYRRARSSSSTDQKIQKLGELIGLLETHSDIDVVACMIISDLAAEIAHDLRREKRDKETVERYITTAVSYIVQAAEVYAGDGMHEEASECYGKAAALLEDKTDSAMEYRELETRHYLMASPPISGLDLACSIADTADDSSIAAQAAVDILIRGLRMDNVEEQEATVVKAFDVMANLIYEWKNGSGQPLAEIRYSSDAEYLNSAIVRFFEIADRGVAKLVKFGIDSKAHIAGYLYSMLDFNSITGCLEWGIEETDSLKDLLRNLIYQSDRNSQIAILTEMIPINVISEGLVQTGSDTMPKWLKFTILPQINVEVITEVVKNIWKEYEEGDPYMKAAILKHMDRFLALASDIEVREKFVDSVVKGCPGLVDDLLAMSEEDMDDNTVEYAGSLLRLLIYVVEKNLISPELWARNSGYSIMLEGEFTRLSESDFGQKLTEFEYLLDKFKELIDGITG